MSIPPELNPRRPRPDACFAASSPDAGDGAARLRLPPDAQIAVFRALALGDMLCAVPALRALRAANPSAEITLIGLPWAREFVARFDRYVDRLVEFPGWPGLPERPVDRAALSGLLEETAAAPFDLAIQLQGNGMHSNGFVELLGARRRAGYFLPAMERPDPETFAPYPGHGPEVRRQLGLMEFLGFPSRGEYLEFPLTGGDEAEAAALRDRHGLAVGAFACVHPGASIPSRRWPPERFAAIADCLAERGLRVVLTGTAGERPLTDAVAAAMRNEATNLAGATSIGAVAALIRDARLLLSNDTGVAHLADALEVPSIVIFLASERERWAALDTRLHAAVGEGAIRGCETHGPGEPRCLRDACVARDGVAGPRDVSIDSVWEATVRQFAVAPAPRRRPDVQSEPSGPPSGQDLAASAKPAARETSHAA